MMISLSKFKILQIWIYATKADIKAEADGSTLFPNTAPEITSSDTGTVVENADISTVIYTATATDADTTKIR